MADPIRNFFKSTLVGTYSNTATSFTIATGDGALLPDPATDGAFNLVIYEGAAGIAASAFEIVRVTAKSGDVLTVTREQEGTTALTIGATTHSIILSATKKTFDDLAFDASNLSNVESLSFATGGDEVLNIPVGTEAQRPAAPSAGMIRWNTAYSSMEVYDGSNWRKITIGDYVGAWVTTSSMNSAKYLLSGVGTVNDAINFGAATSGVVAVTTTEKWSTTSWATTSALNQARAQGAGSGDASNALSFGGWTGSVVVVSTTEKWATSSWVTTSSINTSRRGVAGCGSVDDALSFGGATSTEVNTTEKWSTSSWVTTSSLNTTRGYHAGVGTVNDALCFGGFSGSSTLSTTEKWATSSWSTTSALNQGSFALSGCGNVNDALRFGGTLNNITLYAITEKWNGSSWVTTSSLNTAVFYHSGSGTASDALSFGGSTGANVATTEKWGIS